MKNLANLQCAGNLNYKTTSLFVYFEQLKQIVHLFILFVLTEKNANLVKLHFNMRTNSIRNYKLL